MKLVSEKLKADREFVLTVLQCKRGLDVQDVMEHVSDRGSQGGPKNHAGGDEAERKGTVVLRLVGDPGRGSRERLAACDENG